MKKANTSFYKYKEGVIYEPLGKITLWNKKFNGANHYNNERINIISVSAKFSKSLLYKDGDIKILNCGKEMGFAREDDVKGFINEGEVISLPEGGTANIKYWNGKFVNALNLIAISYNKEIIRTKFIYYYLLNNINHLQNNYRGSGIQHPDMRNILKIQIPIPPINVQDEIIEFLDKLTELKTELKTEYSLRQKQYEYYRNKLLEFGDDVEKEELGGGDELK
ncbi:MAG: restriction endonuclease subunit S [Mycoplasmoidaceae bacterium]